MGKSRTINTSGKTKASGNYLRNYDQYKFSPTDCVKFIVKYLTILMVIGYLFYGNVFVALILLPGLIPLYYREKKRKIKL